MWLYVTIMFFLVIYITYGDLISKNQKILSAIPSVFHSLHVILLPENIPWQENPAFQHPKLLKEDSESFISLLANQKKGHLLFSLPTLDYFPTKWNKYMSLLAY